MREIKFRAWDKINKTIYPVVRLWFENGVLQNVWIETSEGLIAKRSLNEIVLMQYTGVKDSLGNEVWEGDIVQDNIHDGNGDVYFIDYDSREGCYMAFDGYGATHHVGVWLTFPNLSFKVIGNIYENPELLEEEYGN